MIIIHVEPICLAPPVLAPPKLSAVAQHHLNISKLFFYNLVAENFTGFSSSEAALRLMGG